MNTQEVLERFLLIANLSINESAKWTPICSDAVAEIESKLKTDIDKIQNGRRLTAAAAALSFYKYIIYNAAGSGVESFSAGDISIKENTSQKIELASSIWNESKILISDLLRDDNFYFEQVAFI